MAARLTAYAVAFIVGVTVIAGLIVGAQREDDGPVDLIVINGHVYSADRDELAEAVAVRGNKVIRVGSNREIQRLRRAQTIVLDAKGGAVVPGFNEAPAHLTRGGLSLAHIRLAEARPISEITHPIRVWSAAPADRGGSPGALAGQPFSGAMPTGSAHLLARIARHTYFLATAHGLANTRALKSPAFRGRPRIPNAIIVRYPRTGEPTGALKTAMSLVAGVAPAERRRSTRRHPRRDRRGPQPRHHQRAGYPPPPI